MSDRRGCSEVETLGVDLVESRRKEDRSLANLGLGRVGWINPVTDPDSLKDAEAWEGAEAGSEGTGT
jgi:hypothetical protein